MVKPVIITADMVNRRKRNGRIVKLALLLFLLILIVSYIILGILYNVGQFTITLNSNKTLESGLVIFESIDDQTPRRRLEASQLVFMDNISVKWLPDNIATEAEGSHNGNNYIAYTFYVGNQGNLKLHYWYEVILDDVIRNVDEAIRIMVYQNGEPTVYAKANSLSGEPEEGTVAFLDQKDGTIVLKKRPNFSPGDTDRYTVVIWLEGDDPDCVDALKEGGIKMHMNMREEHMENK